MTGPRADAADAPGGEDETPMVGGEPAAPDSLLRVDGLRIDAGPVPLVRDVSFTVAAGDRVGLIGESGSGKSLTALALLGLLPEGLSAHGRARLGDDDLLALPERRLKGLRGRVASMVFQEPMTALNPVQRVGAQVAEVLRLHGGDPGRVPDLLAEVGLPPGVRRAYPHQLSGGQRQRIVLAIALANSPSLVICDEPTTALDVTVQKQVLDLIRARVEAALLFITHDLAVVAQVCSRVLVMYGGRIVETGTVPEVFGRPRHPYTAGLLAASDLTRTDERGRLRTIPGTVPAAGRFPAGCVFRTRCDRADATCQAVPALAGGVACWHPLGVTP